MDVILSTLHGASESRNVSTDAISVPDFLQEAWDDFNSPTTSNFVSRLNNCRSTTATLEEVGGASSIGCYRFLALPHFWNANFVAFTGIFHVGVRRAS